MNALAVERMTREVLPYRRNVWRQKLLIHDSDAMPGQHKFYVDFGEYPDGRLAEIFVTAHRQGTFSRGVLDTLSRSVSMSLQHGTPISEVIKMLRGLNYPPCGTVEGDSTTVIECSSIADYIGQEIEACYDDNGRKPEPEPIAEDIYVDLIEPIPERVAGAYEKGAGV